MDIELTKKAAEEGDADACIEVGKWIYEQKQNAQGMREANKWYEMAANLGHPQGYRMVILGKKVFAHATTQMAAYQEAGEAWNEIADWADKMRKLINCSDDDIAFAEDEFFDACYHVGVCMVCADQADSAYNMFKNVDNVKVNVLKGAAIKINSGEDLINSYQLLSGLEDLEYISMIGDKAEEIVAALGALRISAYYRLIKNDSDQAFSSLDKVANALDDGTGKNIIVDEMQHYKKGLFGGYKYSG